VEVNGTQKIMNILGAKFFWYSHLIWIPFALEEKEFRIILNSLVCWLYVLYNKSLGALVFLSLSFVFGHIALQISFERLKIVVCNICSSAFFCRLLISIYINLTFFGIISSILMSKSLELDQTPSYSASDQDLSCLQRLLQLRFFTLQSSKGYRDRIFKSAKT